MRIFGLATVLTLVICGATLWWGGPEMLAIVAILGVLELSLSFDNAIVNATVLRRMSAFWQRIFLTLGILIAVFGMRLIFPILIVAFTADLSPLEAFRLALEDPAAYSDELRGARPAIASFGGMFLLMIFFDFLLQEREYAWLKWIERPLARLGGIESIGVALALTALLLTAALFGGESQVTVLVAGCAGILVFILVNGLAGFFEIEADPSDEKASGIAGPSVDAGGAAAATGKAALFLFLYLEVLDASFSFDGVIGAFAITTNIVLIAAGLGIGAIYVRSLTIYLVRQGTLARYVYLEHGAHYAIGALAIILLVSLAHEVPELFSGLVGVSVILLALGSSVLHIRRGRASSPTSDGPNGPPRRGRGGTNIELGESTPNGRA